MPDLGEVSKSVYVAAGVGGRGVSVYLCEIEMERCQSWKLNGIVLQGEWFYGRDSVQARLCLTSQPMHMAAKSRKSALDGET